MKLLAQRQSTVIVVVVAPATGATAPQESPEISKDPMTPIFAALWGKEASHRLNPPDGDDGRSIGPYQIQHAYWADAGLPGRWEDCRQIEYARRVMLAYWQRYCPEALDQADAEVLARTHNGGPQGAHRAATLPYWADVQARLAAGAR